MDEDPSDANGYRLSQSPGAKNALEQRVLNESWPLSDSNGQHARSISDQPADNQRPCWVRLELATDGEVRLPGLAARWNKSHVFVIVDDPRVPRRQVWVRAHDVRPREA